MSRRLSYAKVISGLFEMSAHDYGVDQAPHRNLTKSISGASIRVLLEGFGSAVFIMF